MGTICLLPGISLEIPVRAGQTARNSRARPVRLRGGERHEMMRTKPRHISLLEETLCRSRPLRSTSPLLLVTDKRRNRVSVATISRRRPAHMEPDSASSLSPWRPRLDRAERPQRTYKGLKSRGYVAIWTRLDDTRATTADAVGGSNLRVSASIPPVGHTSHMLSFCAREMTTLRRRVGSRSPIGQCSYRTNA
jgi:hypothetical protein